MKASGNKRYIQGIVERMRSGEACHFSRHFIEDDWPQRGNNLFLNIALAIGKNRPEPEESTLFQFNRFVNQFGKFAVSQKPQDGEFLVTKEDAKHLDRRVG